MRPSAGMRSAPKPNRRTKGATFVMRPGTILPRAPTSELANEPAVCRLAAATDDFCCNFLALVQVDALETGALVVVELALELETGAWLEGASSIPRPLALATASSSSSRHTSQGVDVACLLIVLVILISVACCFISLQVCSLAVTYLAI